jgi:HEAT repeat protein
MHTDTHPLEIEALIGVLQHNDGESIPGIPEKMIAVQRLGRLKARQAVRFLIAALSDPANTTGIDFTNPIQSPCVASEIVHTLAELGARDAVPVLLQLLKNEFGFENEIIRVEAAHALGVLKAREAIVTLIRKVKELQEAEAVRSAAIWALGEIGDPSILSVIKDLGGIPERLQPAIYAAMIKLNSV